MIRWGILGSGKIAKTFAKEFQFITNAEIVFAASSEQNKARDFAAAFSIPNYGTYQDIFTSDLVDVIYIALPHSHHYPFIIKSLEAGKHVLSEKPITVNALQLKEVISLATQRKLFVMEAMWTLFLPAVQIAKRWCNEGRIGEIVSLSAEFAFPAPNPGPERLYNPNLAGGCLLDIGIYPITVCRYFMEKLPTHFSLQFQKSSTGVDKALNLLLSYEHAMARLSCAFTHRAQNSAFIFGTDGYIEIPVFWKSKNCKLYSNDGNVTDHFDDSSSYHGFFYEIDHVNACLNRNQVESQIMPLSLSLEILDFMDKVRKEMDVIYPFE
jgi:predicted dehydrogenase